MIGITGALGQITLTHAFRLGEVEKRTDSRGVAVRRPSLPDVKPIPRTSGRAEKIFECPIV
ncbi:MAG: hypothetical protein QM696_02370 [Steroidobacteraceae bacterium]